MENRSMLSLIAVTLSVGYAIWVLFTFKLAIDVNPSARSIWQIKTPIESLLIVMGTCFLCSEALSDVFAGYWLGLVAGLHYFFTMPHPEYVQQGSFAQGVLRFYGLTDLVTSTITCGLFVMIAGGTGISFYLLLRLIKKRRRLTQKS
jgi:hypothetical protein